MVPPLPVCHAREVLIEVRLGADEALDGRVSDTRLAVLADLPWRSGAGLAVSGARCGEQGSADSWARDPLPGLGQQPGSRPRGPACPVGWLSQMEVSNPARKPGSDPEP